MKVCSLYGVGFYYIPGTDICMKIGGYVRAEYSYGNTGNSLTNLDITGTDGQRTRVTGSDWNQRARAFLLQDTRQQTAYGTLRTYMNIGFSFDLSSTIPAAVPEATVYANRAMIQLAGFTFGLATSYFDFYSSPATSYSVPWSSDTGDGGWKVLAYTAQFGNGVSATLSLENPRRAPVTSTSTTANFAIGAAPTAQNVKIRSPDVVANIRVDQAWGSAQIMGALHDASAGYYSQATVGSASNGHPGDVWGWAAGLGVRINTPFISPGNYFQAQVNVARGATRYVAVTPAGTSGSPGVYNGASSLGVGWFSDGVFSGATSATGTSVELTSAFSAQAAYEHFWTPALRTSLVGGYTSIRYSDAATTMLCNGVGGAGGALAGLTNCGPGSFNWSYWSLSSRTQWNITRDFYIGLEQFYGRLQTMSRGQTATVAATTFGTTAGLRTLEDQNVWVTRFRVHRDIVP